MPLNPRNLSAALLRVAQEKPLFYFGLSFAFALLLWLLNPIAGITAVVIAFAIWGIAGFRESSSIPQEVESGSFPNEGSETEIPLDPPFSPERPSQFASVPLPIPTSPPRRLTVKQMLEKMGAKECPLESILAEIAPLWQGGKLTGNSKVNSLEVLVDHLVHGTGIVEEVLTTLRSNEIQKEELVIFFLLAQEMFPHAALSARNAQRLEDAIYEKLLQSLQQEEKTRPGGIVDDELKQRADRDILIHVGFLDKIDPESAYLLIRSIPTTINYDIILTDQEAVQGGDGRFIQWQNVSGPNGRKSATANHSSSLPVSRVSTVHFAPEEYKSRVMDFVIDHTAGYWQMPQLAKITQLLNRDYKIKVTPLAEPLPSSALKTTDKKGSIRAVAMKVDGKLTIFGETQYRTPLRRSSTNMLFRDMEAAIKHTKTGEKINWLLPELIKNSVADLEHIIHSGGNFRLDFHIDHEAGGKRGRFRIKPYGDAVVGVFEQRMGMSGEEWQDQSRYQPLEKDKYQEVPRGYLMTGDAHNCLFLEIKLGSPGLVQAEVQSIKVPTKPDDLAIESAFSRFAKLYGYEQLDILFDHNAQGLVATAVKNGKECFLKLLDPSHVYTCRTDVIVETLLANELLPSSIEMIRIVPETGRIAEKPDEIPSSWALFVSPRFRMVPDWIKDRMNWRLPARVEICQKMADFAETLWNKHHIACLDWSLSETVVSGPLKAIKTFVVDYGAYLYTSAIANDRNNRKSQLFAPEDNLERGLRFEGERNQVYVLGILFLQALTSQPEVSPAFISAADEATWNEMMKNEIIEQFSAAGISDVGEAPAAQLIELLEQMLRWQPSDRPLLSQVCAALRAIQF